MKRLEGISIPKHIRYSNGLNDGTVQFAGVRTVEGCAMALLKTKDDEIIVLPVSDAVARRLKNLKVGTACNLEKGGITTISTNIKIRGKKR